MIRLHHVLLAGALLALSAAPSQAAFSGSLSVNGFKVTSNPSGGLLNGYPSNTVFTAQDNTVGSADGDFGSISSPLSFGGTALDLSNVAGGLGLVLTNSTWGTFTATSGSLFEQRIVDGQSTLSFAVVGTYTGGPAGNTSFSGLITFNQAGDGVTGQVITLEVPAIPEPSSVALGAIGLVSMSLVALRKRRSK